MIHRNLADLGKLLNPFVYEKAGWVLHMLRRQVGTERFWDGLRAYYRRYQGRTASTRDFRTVMEEVSGQDLGWFFDQWLTRPGLPRIEGSWSWDAKARRVTVDLAQTQPGEAHRLKLDLAIGTAVEPLEFTGQTLQVSFPAATEPASVSLDPGVWTLMTGRLVKR